MEVQALDYFRDRHVVDTTGVDGVFAFVIEPGFEYDVSVEGPRPTSAYGFIRGLFAATDTTIHALLETPSP